MDLRMFFDRGLDDVQVWGAVRYGDYACIGRGFGNGVHGGAIESCLDELTAECAKVKLFPTATTSRIEFKIKKPVSPHRILFVV